MDDIEKLQSELQQLSQRIYHTKHLLEKMSDGRPYRKYLSPERTIEELNKCAGSQFDPEIVEIFISVLKDGEALRTEVPHFSPNWNEWLLE